MGQDQPRRDRRRRHLLVTGSHRSGTTWVGKTLTLSGCYEYVNEPFNAHPKDLFADPDVDEKIDTWFLHAPGYEREAALRSALAARLQQVESGASESWPGRILPWRLGRRRHPRHALLKDPIALMSAPWLDQAFDLDVLCMIRNPLAFVGSLKRWGWWFGFDHLERQEALMEGTLAPYAAAIRREASQRGDIVDHAALLWNCLHHVIADYRKQHPGWLFVRYEDLAASPVPGFRHLYERLGLPMDTRVVRTIEAQTSARNPAEPDNSTFTARDSRGSLDTWRERLDDAEIQRVVEATRDVASHFYEWRDGGFV